MNIPTHIPLLPIRNAVTLPGISMPLVVGRKASILALKHAKDNGGLIAIVTQKHATTDDPELKDLYNIATLCKIDSLTGTDERGYQILATGIHRYQIHDAEKKDGFWMATGEIVPDDPNRDEVRTLALFNSLKELSKDLLSLLPGIDESVIRLVDKLTDAAHLTYLCAAYLNISIEQRQRILEEISIIERMEILLGYMQKEREVLEVQKDIRDKMSERMSQAQREALLREQLRAIREELGESEGAVRDDIQKKIEEAELPEEARKVAEKEMERLEHIPSASAEYNVIRSYLEWLADMPWNKSTKDILELDRARQILDEDHYGLDKVKKRILQYLAVAKLKNNLRGPILCLVGPPGVGKTSLGQSIARALGREFVRASLGGIRDEAEIRGHRRTYVGAMPGRIVQSIKRVGVNNPVMMLDEIDKLGASYQGDPAAAMLELLDPEQNNSFVDHYLDVPFDFSNVFFVATANYVDAIPAALRDRLEIIDLSSYTTNEKLHIAKNYLIPKQLKEHGLDEKRVIFEDVAVEALINHYTREAGVRELQRTIATVIRSAAEDIASNKAEPIVVNEAKVEEALGLKKFHPEVSERLARAGVVTGLAWTPFGGDILFIEASTMEGNGQLKLTGQLGDVMKESAFIAMSFIRSELKHLMPNFQSDKTDIHIHVPSGAIPKDGPSAGVTMLTAITSILTGKRVDPTIAMTGEITLRGNVLPVGGIKEKVLAAHRAGIQEVIIPKRNEPDIRDVPETVRDQLKFHFVADMREVLQIALKYKSDELSQTSEATKTRSSPGASNPEIDVTSSSAH